MKAFIGVLIICGIYSTESASVGFSQTSPCANEVDGSFVPVIGDCAQFYMCLKGEVILSSCGSNLHFDPVGKQCIDISRSLCVWGKKSESSKIDAEKTESKKEVLVKVETRPLKEEVKPAKVQGEEAKPHQKHEAKPKPVENEKKVEAKPQPEEFKPVESEKKPEESKPQASLLKPVEGEKKPEEPKPQSALLKPAENEKKPEAKPKPEELKPVESEKKPEVKPEVKPEAKPEEPKPQPTLLKPVEGEKKPEEPKPQAALLKPAENEKKPEAKPQPEELKPVESEKKPEAKPEESKPQATLLKPVESEKKPESKPQPEESKPQAPTLLKPVETEPKPETIPQPEEVVNDFCLGKAIGSFVPSKLSCNEYYVCLGNRIVQKKCPSGLHFNAEIRSCTIPSLANCLLEREKNDQVEPIVAEEKPQEQAQPEQETNEITSIAAEKLCSGQDNGVMFPVPGSCTKYFACLQESTFELTCGLRHFDPVSRVCVPAEESRCVEAIPLEDAVQAPEKLDTNIGDTYLGSENEGIVISNANLDVSNSGTVKNMNVVSASSGIAAGNTDLGTSNSYSAKIELSGQNKTAETAAVLENPASFDGAKPKNISIGDPAVGQNNSGIVIGNANVNISNSGTVSNANFVVASQNVAAGNTNLGTSNYYSVSGTNLVVNNKTVPIKQTGLPVNKKQVSKIDNVDVEVSNEGVSVHAEGVAETKDINAGDTYLGAGNKGVVIGNANLNVSNTGIVTDLNVVSGSQNSVAGNTNLGLYNSYDLSLEGVAVPEAVEGLEGAAVDQEAVEELESVVAVPESTENENKEIVIAVVEEESARMCAGVPSGTLYPKLGDCAKFLTCEDGVAYVGACPHGLHFNAISKMCDWPEVAGCV